MINRIILLTIIFNIISFNLYAHDFIWGISQNEYIRINGQPDEIRKKEDSNNTLLIYEHSYFDRVLEFSSNGLIIVVEFHGPYFSAEEATTMSQILLFTLFRDYTYVETKTTDDGPIFTFKYRNDDILFNVRLISEEVSMVMIMYISPFMD